MATEQDRPHAPEQVAQTQKGLLKILSVATAIPMVLVVLMAWSLFKGASTMEPSEQGFAQFMWIFGLLTPLVWVSSYGYTWLQIKRGNMKAGHFYPLLPAFWIILWYAALYTR
jgi:hypothetical protein